MLETMARAVFAIALLFVGIALALVLLAAWITDLVEKFTGARL